MKLYTIIGLFLLASCSNEQENMSIKFRRYIPDTSKTWAGQMTRDAYNQTRSFEKKLNLEKLLDGTKSNEYRIWYLSGFYDPQVLLIVKEDSINNWTLRTISFYQAKSDNRYADYTRIFRPGSMDSLTLNQYWYLTSQSNLNKGDSYGCMDGTDMFIEMATSYKYRFIWYRCPEINKNKDSSFLLASELADKLNSLVLKK